MSQGQLQRILLARAFYKDTPFLFLDEATSALDHDTESRILELLKLNTNQTIVIISHRKHIVDWVDKVVELG